MRSTDSISVEEEHCRDSCIDNSHYQYVVTAHPPTIVTHAIVCDFLSHHNLVLARVNHLQIYTATRSSLSLSSDLPIYGRIAILQAFRPRTSSFDWLLVVTERLHFLIVAYNEATGLIDTKASGDASDKVGRLTDYGLLAVIEPNCAMFGLHIYDGLLKVIPMTDGGTSFGAAFVIRLEELLIVSMTFLHGATTPSIAVLFEDTRRHRFMRTYVVDMELMELKRDSVPDAAVETSADRLVAVPAPICGLLIFTNTQIQYRNGAVVSWAVATSGAPITSVGRIDQDGSRYLVGDSDGVLFLLCLRLNVSGNVVSLVLERLGVVPQPSALAYIDSGFAFVGSRYGDSALIQLSAEPDCHGDFVQIRETFPNLGPISDMAVLTLEQRAGQCQLVTCSGTLSDGSLRIICNGIGLRAHFRTPAHGINNIWSLRSSQGSQHHNILVQSYPFMTRTLGVSGKTHSNLEDVSVPGFMSERSTIFCANLFGDFILQVTDVSVRRLKTGSEEISEWFPEERSGLISAATAVGDYVAVAVQSGALYLLQVLKTGIIVVVSSASFDDDISCLCISPDAAFMFIGFWVSHRVSVFSLPSLTPQTDCSPIGELAIPRSLCVTTLSPSSPLFLICGLADGSVSSYTLVMDGSNHLCKLTLVEYGRVILGTHPVTLTLFESYSKPQIFACCDRPTLIAAGSADDLVFTSANLKSVTAMAPLTIRAELPTPCIALSSLEEFVLGELDPSQRLHVRTVALREQPRRLVHHALTHTLLVCTLAVIQNGDNREEDPTEMHYIRLYDDQSFEDLQCITMEPYENVCSATLASLDYVDYFVVGTGFTMPGDEEPLSGRILVYAMDPVRREMSLYAQKSVNGAVYAVNAFMGRILSTINSTICVWSLGAVDDDNDALRTLHCDCSHQGHVLSLYLKSRGNMFIVGDLIKSVTLMSFDPECSRIREVARDFNPSWTVCVEMLDDSGYLAANNSYNLMTLRRNTEATTDDDRIRLNISGRYHVGEFINVIRQGSLVACVAGDIQPQLLFGTTSGMIGVLASLTLPQFTLLSKLQNALADQVTVVGGLSHSKWRSFQNMEGVIETIPTSNYIDGDLIEQYLDLPATERQQISEEIDVPLNELSHMVQRLRNIR